MFYFVFCFFVFFVFFVFLFFCFFVFCFLFFVFVIVLFYFLRKNLPSSRKSLHDMVAIDAEFATTNPVPFIGNGQSALDDDDEEEDDISHEDGEVVDDDREWSFWLSDLELQSILSLRGVNPARFSSSFFLFFLGGGFNFLSHFFLFIYFFKFD